MPSPFPGMDPYLEGPDTWPDIHHGLITATRDALSPQVAPAYYVRIDRRTYIVEVDQKAFIVRPDAAIIVASSQAAPAGSAGAGAAVATAPQRARVPLYEEVREGYLEIRDTRTHEVVTVIELLSPTNKLPGDGRTEYEAKRRGVLKSFTNLVEIDPIRIGQPMEITPLPQADYRIVVAAGWERPEATVYAFGIRDPIPEISVPLRENEPAACLTVGELLAGIYDRARYDLSTDYTRNPPAPPLSRADAAWVRRLLRAHR